MLCQEVEAEKPTKLGDNHSVSSVEQHEKMATERSAVKKIQRPPQKAPKSTDFVNTPSDDSGTEDDKEPAVKQSQEVPKSLELVNTDSDDSDNDKPMIKRMQKLPKNATPGKELVLPVVKQLPS